MSRLRTMDNINWLLALDRRGRESGVPGVRVPAPLPLRRSPCTRLFQGRTSPARRAHRRGLACRREPAAGRRSMAPRSRARRGAGVPVRRVGGTRSVRCVCSVGTSEHGSNRPAVRRTSSILAPAGLLVIFKLCAREGTTKQTSKETKNAKRTGRKRSMRGCSHEYT